MAERTTLTVGKAERTLAAVPVPDVRIDVAAALPAYSDLAAWDAYCHEQARQIEELLHQSLPGSTYDRLLGRMFARKASHYRVPHDSGYKGTP